MRADRLLSLLMLLQARGRMTAGELSSELEVSERTIYRDMDALSMAGVPVYSETGRTGGYELLESYRTSLTGLTEAEAQAMQYLSIPAPLAELGVGAQLKTALLKLMAALRVSHREAEGRLWQRFHLDATWWKQGRERTPYLATIHEAVLEARKLWVTYSPMHSVQIERLVMPYGMAAKAGVWYLVYASRGAVRARPVSDFLEARLTEEPFEWPSNFDLAVFWKEWAEKHEEALQDFAARVRVSPRLLPLLPYYFDEQVNRQAEAQVAQIEDGWVEMELSFESFEDARSRLLGFGGGVEALAPPALRQSVQDYIEQAAAVYEINFNTER